MNKKYEKAFDEFLNNEKCEELNEIFYKTVKAAFEAGYKSKKPILIPPIIINDDKK